MMLITLPSILHLSQTSLINRSTTPTQLQVLLSTVLRVAAASLSHLTHSLEAICHP